MDFFEMPNELHLRFQQPEAKAEVHTTRSWRGVSAQFSRLKMPAEYDFKWDGHSHYLAHHDLVLLDGEMQVLGEKPIAGGDLRDLMTFVPVGQTIVGWSKPAVRLNSFTVVYFDPIVMEEELQSEFSNIDPHAHIYFNDNELGATMRKLGKVMAANQQLAGFYTETIALTAALEIFQFTQADARHIKTSGALSSQQARSVRDYINENLARDIGLDDLAAVCNLTRFHFSRAFKATFGQPPYRYLNIRRVERGQRMLVETRIAIGDVAIACGFSGASQFGRAFRDVVGKTPLEFRRQA
ncbi:MULTISPECIES: helix-turn-helix domain-containing protein [unclassified Rhizobium]|uniref:helix-turn-helix domain-containing protein n=1 Tax=unclassified Rhizobium TaxID=2613769 RepID=UPI00177EC208|nr:helix-turn-helix transcriptional regulator [Rhizobium sp. CFBP 13644]MBD8694190.1 helix-turn-helix transcriptional regulator [Rhizobium sp. CFBP 13717]